MLCGSNFILYVDKSFLISLSAIYLRYLYLTRHKMNLAPAIETFVRKLHLYASVIINKGLIFNLVIIRLIRFLKYTFVLNMVKGSRKFIRDITGIHLRTAELKLLTFEELSQ